MNVNGSKKLYHHSKKSYFFSLTTGPFGGSCQIHGPIPPVPHSESDDLTAVPDLDMGPPSGIKSPIINNPAFSHSKCPPRVHRSCFCVRFIAEHTKMQEDSTKVCYSFMFFILYIYIPSYNKCCNATIQLLITIRSTFYYIHPTKGPLYSRTFMDFDISCYSTSIVHGQATQLVIC